MGMSASQGRLLFLTARKSDIELQEQVLSNRKIALARDSEKVYQDYNDALKQKRLKFSNNAGYNYIDVSYSNLMRPSSMNLNEPYILTDPQDRVVVDDKYLEYAKIISPNGYAGGDWSPTTRAKVLSQVTGIGEDKILSADTSFTNVNDAIQNYSNIAPEPVLNVESDPTKLMKNLESVSIGNTNWYNAYMENTSISIGTGASAANTLKSYLNQLTDNLRKFFPDQEAYEEACKNAIEAISHENEMTNGQSFGEEDAEVYGGSSGYNINVKALVDAFLAFLTNNDNELEWVDTTSSEYQDWKTKHDEWEEQEKEAWQSYQSALSADNELLTSEEEALILFYDKIFSTIAENGWTYNEQVSDTDYLNQVLQNGNYSITQVGRIEEYDDRTDTVTRTNNYQTNIATNFDNIVTVSDSEIREEAYVKYQKEKSIIEKKENQIDIKMKNLDTELSAINEMIKGIETVRNDNADRTMNIFT